MTRHAMETFCEIQTRPLAERVLPESNWGRPSPTFNHGFQRPRWRMPVDLDASWAVSLPEAKSGLKLGVGQMISQASSFLRSVIIPRLISPESFGIAAVLAMTFALFELASNLATETLLI